MQRLLIFLWVFQSTIFYAQKQSDKKIVPQEIILELKSMIESDQKYRSLISDSASDMSTSEIDSLWNLQITTDYQNTKRAIELIREFGYISSSNSNSRVPLHIILMHSANSFKDELQLLIDNEKVAERIPIGSYGMINWHLNGRKEPQFEFFTKKDTVN